MGCFEKLIQIHLIAWISLQAATLRNLVEAAGDQEALLAFKAMVMAERFDIKSEWNTTTHFCQWYGVTCSRRHPRVTKLELQSAGLAGKITSYIGNLSFLEVLDLQDNDLSGEIPEEVGRLSRLEILRLSSNSLVGEIPANISGWSMLASINVSYNQLTGEIPMELGHLKSLKQVNLGHNGLQGNLPSSLGNLSSLEILALAENMFSGHIPEAIGDMKNLQFFSVAANQLSGVVPPSIFNLSHMRVLDVGTNYIEGSLPLDLGTTLPELEVLALTYNSITGDFPLSISNISSLVQLEVGGNKLTGNMPNFGKLDKLQEFAIAVNQLGSRGPDDLSFICSLTNATNLQVINANDNNFGGKVPECIANLSTSLAYFSLNNNQGNDFKALVYEFMSNGSLEEWLHPNELSAEFRNLNFLQRLSIAIDVACALEYLHCDCETPIVHCDIKPSNVLLDDDLTGHVGDFGLVRILSEPLKNSSKLDSSTVGIKGTVGYAAPEYAMGSEVSTYGDVYSYGILLLELFTGKRPTESSFKDGLNLRDFVNRALPERVAEIVDPSLASVYQESADKRSSSQFQLFETCFITVLQIGLACSSELPRERMSINGVESQLNLVRDKLSSAAKY